MSEELLLYNLVENIAVLTLNSTKRRNALSLDMLSALKARLDSIQEDRDVAVVVIRASGPVFSSGHDLRELAEGEEEDHIRLFSACTDVMESIRLLRQPVIAQVQGLATAAGCQLVATCDLVVASVEAAFATPGVSIGLFCTTPGVAIGRAMSQKKALEMLLTGTPVSADEALAFGLVNQVVPHDELEERAMELARRIASASTHTVGLGKPAFCRQLELDRPEAYKLAESVMVENLRSHDAGEGIDAFLTKRKAEWLNR